MQRSWPAARRRTLFGAHGKQPSASRIGGTGARLLGSWFKAGHAAAGGGGAVRCSAVQCRTQPVAAGRMVQDVRCRNTAGKVDSVVEKPNSPRVGRERESKEGCAR